MAFPMGRLFRGAVATAPAVLLESWRCSKAGDRKNVRCDRAEPVVVLGGGVMGLSTAWSLSRGGVQVMVLDANHSEKGSWGESRIARVSYVDPVMLRLARRSYELYDELAKISGEQLMHTTGCLDVGFKRGSLDNLAATYEELGQSYERLNHQQVAQRWPMLQLSKEYVEASVFCPNGDAVLASVVLEALKEQLLTSASAKYVEGAVVSVDRKRKIVTLEDGRRIRYSKLVLAAGIWTNHVLQAMNLPLLPLVTSVEQQTYYAAPEGTEHMYSAGQLPVIIEHNPSPEPQMKRRGGYMIPHVPHGVDGVKFGMHRQGPLMDHKDFPLLPGSTGAVEKIFAASGTRGLKDLWTQRWPEEEDQHLRSETDAFGRRVLPSLKLQKSELTMRCPYDQHLYKDEDFVVGIHPQDPNLVVVCGFAGEGFKFGPAIGEMAAALVTGRSFAVPESLERFRLERPSHVG